MKRLGFDSENAHIVKIATPEPQQTENNKSGFDIAKLLQILPKLNLNGLFGGQNSNTIADNQQFTSHPTPADNPSMEFGQTQNLMAAHNVALAKSSLETHINLVNKLKE